MQDKEVRECEDILEDLYNFSPNNNEICLADYVITSDLLSELQEKLEQSQQDLKVAVEALEEIKVNDYDKIGLYDDELEGQIDRLTDIAIQALAKLRKESNEK